MVDNSHRTFRTRPSEPASHALAHRGKAGWSLEEHLQPRLASSRAAEQTHHLLICHSPNHLLRKMPMPGLAQRQLWWQGAESVCVCARVHFGQAGWWALLVFGAHQESLFGWARLNNATLGGFMALDHPGAAGLGHAPFLHRRSLGERQRAPRALQPGALEDLGQAWEAKAAEWRPAAHGRIAQVRTRCASHNSPPFLLE